MEINQIFNICADNHQVVVAKERSTGKSNKSAMEVDSERKMLRIITVFVFHIFSLFFFTPICVVVVNCNMC